MADNDAHAAENVTPKLRLPYPPGADTANTWLYQLAKAIDDLPRQLPRVPTPQVNIHDPATRTTFAVAWRVDTQRDTAQGDQGYTWVVSPDDGLTIDYHQELGKMVLDVSGAREDTRYTVIVKAHGDFDTYGDSNWDVFQVTTPGPQKLETPEALGRSAVAVGSVELTWFTIDGVDTSKGNNGYAITVSPSAKVEPVEGREVTGSTSVWITGLRDDTTYTITVTALGDGTDHLDSDPATVQVTTH